MDYYNSISKGYNDLHKGEQMNKIQIIKDNLSFEKDSRLLDVGCGTFFSAEVFDCEVYGIEPSIEMMKQNLNFEKLIGKKIFHGGAEDIDKFFEKDFFNFVMCVTSAHHFSDFEKSFRNISSVSTKSADIVFSLLKSESFEKILALIKNYFHVNKIVDEGKDTIFFCTTKDL